MFDIVIDYFGYFFDAILNYVTATSDPLPITQSIHISLHTLFYHFKKVQPRTIHSSESSSSKSLIGLELKSVGSNK